MLKGFRDIIYAIAAVLLLIVFSAILLMMVIGPPAVLAGETWQLLRMRESTSGVIVSSKIEGRSKASRPVVTYTFRVDGRTYQSDRFDCMPIKFSSTGGGKVARAYKAGAPVLVHYDPADPSRSCLNRGWSKFPIGFMLVMWGVLLRPTLLRRLGVRHLFVRAIGYPALWGFALIFLGPRYIRPADWPLALVAVLSAVVINLGVSEWRWRRRRVKRRRWLDARIATSAG